MLNNIREGSRVKHYLAVYVQHSGRSPTRAAAVFCPAFAVGSFGFSLTCLGTFANILSRWESGPAEKVRASKLTPSRGLGCRAAEPPHRAWPVGCGASCDRNRLAVDRLGWVHRWYAATAEDHESRRPQAPQGKDSVRRSGRAPGQRSSPTRTATRPLVRGLGRRCSIPPCQRRGSGLSGLHPLAVSLAPTFWTRHERQRCPSPRETRPPASRLHVCSPTAAPGEPRICAEGRPRPHCPRPSGVTTEHRGGRGYQRTTSFTIAGCRLRKSSTVLDMCRLIRASATSPSPSMMAVAIRV